MARLCFCVYVCSFIHMNIRTNMHGGRTGCVDVYTMWTCVRKYAHTYVRMHVCCPPYNKRRRGSYFCSLISYFCSTSPLPSLFSLSLSLEEFVFLLPDPLISLLLISHRYYYLTRMLATVAVAARESGHTESYRSCMYLSISFDMLSWFNRYIVFSRQNPGDFHNLLCI